MTTPIRFPHAVLLLLLSLFAGLAAAADTAVDRWVTESRGILDGSATALQRFDRDNGALEILTELGRRATTIHARGQRLVDELQSERNAVQVRLESLGPAPEDASEEDPRVAESRNALTQQVKELERQLAAVRTVLLTADDLSRAVVELEQSVLAERLLGRGPDALSVVHANLERVDEWWPTTYALVRAGSGLDVLSERDVVALGLAVFAGIPLGFWLRRRLRRPFNAGPLPENMVGSVLAAVRTCTARGAPMLMAAAAAAGYLSWKLPVDPLPLVTQTAYAILIYLLAASAIRVVLHPCSPARHYLPLDQGLSRRLARRLRVLTGLGVIGYMLFGTPLVQELPLAQHLMVRGVYAVFLIGNLIWVIWLLGAVQAWGHSYRFRSLLVLAFLAVLALELLGYRNLAEFVLIGLLGSITTIAAALLLAYLAGDFFDAMHEGRWPWQARLRRALGLGPDDRFPGLIWLHLAISLLIWGSALLLVLEAWGQSEKGVAFVARYLTEGIPVGSITIVPSQLVGALLIFALLLGATNWLKQRLVPRWMGHTGLDRGAREAVTTMSGYIGVLLATLIGLSVAGVEFKNLALIAGALSVGIGFGLQNVVSNFISGIILLFERPIRTGDWVVVGATEGYVRRISIRSTVIQTFDRADVIVPNSELISNQVTNWMLRDPYGRVVAPVGVAYDSDPRQVEQILLRIASEHPQTLTDGRLAPVPRVLFRGFGDSALLFELRFFIRNVDNKLIVLSDVNHAVFQAFREAGITIPFPQRDVNFRYAGPAGEVPEAESWQVDSRAQNGGQAEQ